MQKGPWNMQLLDGSKLPNVFKATKVNHPRQLSTQTVQENVILFFPGVGQEI